MKFQGKRTHIKPDHFDVEVRTQEHKCPYCGKKLDAMSGPEQPHPGDISLCIYCAGVLIITDSGQRAATPEEEMELLKDPVVIQIESAIRKARKQREGISAE